MLQKIKKIGIVALVVFTLTGATYFLFNFYSKILIQSYLGKLLKEKCTITGYQFNLFGSLKFKELKSGDALFIKNLTINYNPLSLILFRTINYIHAEEFSINSKIFKKSGKGKSPTFPTTFAIPIQFNEIKINKGSIILDSNKIDLNFIYLAGEGTGNTYRIRSYINSISYNGENLYFYSDIILKKNSVLIKDFEIQNEKLSVSGTSGAIYFPDSIKIKISLLKLQENNARDLSLLYLMQKGKLLISSPEIILHGHTIKEVNAEIQQALPESLLIEKATFKYKENLINGNGFYLIKRRRLSIKNLDISINEEGLKGHITSSMEFDGGNLSGKITSTNLRYLDSEPFQILCDFSFKNGELKISIQHLKSLNSNLTGKVTFSNQTLKIYAKGILSVSDLLREQNGLIDFNIDYALKKDERSGQAYFSGKALTFKKIGLKEVFLNLYSKGQTDTIKIKAQGINAADFQLDSLKALLAAENLKSFTMNLLAFQRYSALSSDLFLSYLGGNNFDCQVRNLQLLMGDSDTVEIKDPLRITKRDSKVLIDDGEILINSKPLSLKGNLDLATKEINVQASANELKIRNLAGISSSFSGIINIAGNLKNPSIDSWINAENLRYKDYKDLNIYASVRLSGSGLIVDSTSIQGPSLHIEGGGFLPLTFSLLPFNMKPSNNEHYKIVVKISGLPIEKIYEFTEKQLILNSMDVYGDIQIEGIYNSVPNLSGFLKVEKVSGIYTPIQLEFSSGEILAELEKDGFTIRRGIASIDHGTVIINGYGKRLFKKEREISLTFAGTNVTLYPTYNIFASGDTKINLLINENGITVKGDALIKEATIFQSIRPSGGSYSQFPQNLNLVLNLRSEGNTFFVNELADIEIKGDLVFQIADGRMLLDGTANVVKGYFLYLDRIFEIQSGYVNFNSSVSLEPEFNLKAFSKVDTFNVYLALSGTMRNPQITLTSEPPLDELNIIYLLTLGRLYGDTTSAGGEELQEIKNRALTLASTLISQNLRRTLRFQELRLATTETTENPSLLIGFYLNPRLYFWYSHDIFDITKDMFRIRYKVNNNFGIFAERDEERRLLVGLDYMYEF